MNGNADLLIIPLLRRVFIIALFMWTRIRWRAVNPWRDQEKSLLFKTYVRNCIKKKPSQARFHSVERVRENSQLLITFCYQWANSNFYQRTRSSLQKPNIQAGYYWIATWSYCLNNTPILQHCKLPSLIEIWICGFFKVISWLPSHNFNCILQVDKLKHVKSPLISLVACCCFALINKASNLSMTSFIKGKSGTVYEICKEFYR